MHEEEILIMSDTDISIDTSTEEINGSEKKVYTLFWLTGNSEIVEGDTISEALNGAGYSAGALRALDFYSEGDKIGDYSWVSSSRSWVPAKISGRIYNPWSSL